MSTDLSALGGASVDPKLLNNIINDLRTLDGAVEKLLQIAMHLQSILSNESRTTKKGRRGRTYMGPEEREEVSQRIKAYWAKRKGEVLEDLAQLQGPVYTGNSSYQDQSPL